MSNSAIILFWILFFLWIIYFWFSIIAKYKKESLSNEDRKALKKRFSEIKKIKSNREKMIFYDKLFHNILLKLWYSWTFWEILKQNPIQIENINKVWELHKIRNKLVHELDFEEKNLEKKLKEYENQIDFILG